MILEKKGDMSLSYVYNTYVHRSDNFYAHWWHDRYEYYQIANPQRHKFGPIMISIPEDPETYLNYAFGTPKYPGLWKNFAFERTWDHRQESLPTYRGACIVKIDDFSAASWEEKQ